MTPSSRPRSKYWAKNSCTAALARGSSSMRSACVRRAFTSEQLTALGRVEQLVVGRGVPQQERQPAGHLEAGVAQAIGIVGVGLAQLHPVQEVGRLQHAGHRQAQALPGVALGQVDRDLLPPAELVGQQRPPVGATSELLQEALHALVARRGRLAAHQGQAPVGVLEDRLGDLVGRLLVLLGAQLRERGGGGPDVEEQVRVGVGLQRHRGQAGSQYELDAVAVLVGGEPRQHGRRGLDHQRRVAGVAIVGAVLPVVGRVGSTVGGPTIVGAVVAARGRDQQGHQRPAATPLIFASIRAHTSSPSA